MSEHGPATGSGRRQDETSDEVALRDLLQRMVAAPPPEPVTTAQIVGRARRSRRRRTTTATLGIAALVLAVAGIGAVVIPMFTRGSTPTVLTGTQGRVVELTANTPVTDSGAEQLAAPLVATSQAAAARRTRPTALATGSGGRAVLLLPDLSNGLTSLRLLLVGNQGESSATLSPPEGLAAFPRSAAGRAMDDADVVQVSTSGSTWRVSVYDIVRATWRQFTFDRGSLRPKVGDDATVAATRLSGGRIFFSVTSSSSGSGADPLFSVATSGGKPRYEQTETSAWDAEDGLLAWTSTTDGEPTYTVRTLATGSEVEVKVPDTGGCRPTALSLGARRIALTQACDDGKDRVALSDLDGRGRAVLEGVGLENADPGQRTLVVSSRSSANPGTFVYDVQTKRLTRLTSTAVSTRLQVGETGTRVFVPVLLPSNPQAEPGVSWIDWPLGS